MFKKIDILLLFTIIMSLVAYNLWSVIHIQNFFQKSESIFIFSCTLCALEAIKHSILNSYFITQYLCYVLVFFALNNVLDNLFFNPFIIQWNEYLFAIIALIASYFITRKQTQNAKI